MAFEASFSLFLNLFLQGVILGSGHRFCNRRIGFVIGITNVFLQSLNGGPRRGDRPVAPAPQVSPTQEFSFVQIQILYFASVSFRIHQGIVHGCNSANSAAFPLFQSGAV
jgi:hypothetical protein